MSAQSVVWTNWMPLVFRSQQKPLCPGMLVQKLLYSTASFCLCHYLRQIRKKKKMQSNCSHGHSSNQFLIHTCSTNWMQYVFCSSEENTVMQRGLNELAKEAVPKERGPNTNIPTGQIRACSSVFRCLALKFSEFL